MLGIFIMVCSYTIADELLSANSLLFNLFDDSGM
jgi:hypothetical protein